MVTFDVDSVFEVTPVRLTRGHTRVGIATCCTKYNVDKMAAVDDTFYCFCI